MAWEPWLKAITIQRPSEPQPCRVTEKQPVEPPPPEISPPPEKRRRQRTKKVIKRYPRNVDA